MLHDYSKPLTGIEKVIDLSMNGSRLDVILRKLFPHRSRSFFQKSIRHGRIKLNGMTTRPSIKVYEGDVIKLDIDKSPYWIDPLKIPLTILEERDDLIAISKRPRQLIHPVGKIQGGTLLNALHARHNLRNENSLYRPQVIHRLDNETSGVVIFAKGKNAASHYAQLFENRLVSKIYLALFDGVFKSPFSVNKPLGQSDNHPVRVRQEIQHKGKPAQSDFFPLAWNKERTLAYVKIHTGRSHQIRVHAAFEGHPIMGDPLYNPKDQHYQRWTESQKPDAKPGRPDRQLLHAWNLSLMTPQGEKFSCTAPIPNDFYRWGKELVKKIKQTWYDNF